MGSQSVGYQQALGWLCGGFARLFCILHSAFYLRLWVALGGYSVRGSRFEVQVRFHPEAGGWGERTCEPFRRLAPAREYARGKNVLATQRTEVEDLWQ